MHAGRGVSRSHTAAELGRRVGEGDRLALARLLSLVEAGDVAALEATFELPVPAATHTIGFTGAPGAGKSSLIDQVARDLRGQDIRVGVLAVDPSSPYTGGALLGDRVRMMHHVGDHGIFIRSLANRGHLGGLSAAMPPAIRAMLGAGFDHVLVETVGVGQAEVEVARHADTTVVVTAPGMGDTVQMSKAGILEIADVLVVNKCDRNGAESTIQDLEEMVHLRKHSEDDWPVPVIATQATEGEGISELVGTLRDHRAHAEPSGALERHRAARSLVELRAYTTTRVLRRCEEMFRSERGQQLSARVADGELSPMTAADELISELGGRSSS